MLAEFGDDPDRDAEREPEEVLGYVTDHPGLRNQMCRTGPTPGTGGWATPCPSMLPPSEPHLAPGRSNNGQRDPSANPLTNPQRALANRLSASSMAALRNRTLYAEHLAWHSETHLSTALTTSARRMSSSGRFGATRRSRARIRAGAGEAGRSRCRPASARPRSRSGRG